MSEAIPVELKIPTNIETRTRIFKKDEEIPASPSKIYYVEQGAVKVIKPIKINDGDKKLVGNALLRVLGPKKTFELHPSHVTPSNVDDIMSPKVIAIESPTVVSWYYEKMLKGGLMSIRRQYYNDLKVESRVCAELSYILMIQDNKLKIVEYLKFLHRNYGSGSALISGNLRHVDIAAMLGLARVTVTRLLGDLKKEGFLTEDKAGRICPPSNDDFFENMQSYFTHPPTKAIIKKAPRQSL
jgi:CRP-like cAMP-binding protein